MIARPPAKTQVLGETSVRQKLSRLPASLEAHLRGELEPVPFEIARDLEVLPIRALPPKRGLATAEGQARLVHDLASIELQAMELGVRTLSEFSEAPRAFREELCQVTADEGRHLALCLEALEELGYPWGSFPAHVGLWQAVGAEDSLLDRILIVHRYLEGSGLDASQTILRRLSGVKAHAALKAVETIARDELGHVRFGSRWYHNVCRIEKLSATEDFGARLRRLAARLPHRREPLNHELRRQAGFLEPEILALEAFVQEQNRR